MKNNYKNQGFALLFTILIISIIVAITSGVSVTLAKNLTLSSTARESQIAFYEADTAGECALFAMRFADLDALVSSSGTFSCGSLTLDVTSPSTNQYNLTDSNTGSDPCFTINIDKTGAPSVVIEARGYNSCSGNNIVERGIEISY